MKSRLRKIANHVEPFINQEVEYKVHNPDGNITENRSEEFLLAKKLFAATPFISANSLIYAFAEKIQNGDYDSLGSIEEAEDNWGEWLGALNDFLNEAGVLESHFFNEASLKKKIAGPNNLYGDQYSDSLYTNDYLDMNKDVNKGKVKAPPTDKENFISNSYLLAKDLINGLPIVPRYDLMSQIAQDIERGDFDDISSPEEARSNWDAWLARARRILQSRNIILSNKVNKRLKK